MRYGEELNDDERAVSFVHAKSYQYHCDGTDLFRIPSLAEQFEFVTLLRANSSGRVSSNGVREVDVEVSDAAVVEKRGEES